MMVIFFFLGAADSFHVIVACISVARRDVIVAVTNRP